LGRAPSWCGSDETAGPLGTSDSGGDGPYGGRGDDGTEARRQQQQL